MKTRIVPFMHFGIIIYEVQTRPWWWPFWGAVVHVTSLTDAQNIAREVRLGLLKP